MPYKAVKEATRLAGLQLSVLKEVAEKKVSAAQSLRKRKPQEVTSRKPVAKKA
jgi:hypothetical protein